MKKAYLNWSSGKDAAFALYKIQQEREFSVERLLTTINSDFDRITMHGVHNNLLKKQVEAVGIPLHKISLPGNVPMNTYNEIMERETSKLISEGFRYSIFGDILLEDLKEYREKELKKVGLEAVFPLWNMDTRKLMNQFLSAGFKAITVCVNASVLDKSFCGRIVDENFLAELPEDVDPCGENGEFHTFVFDGPIFKNPVAFRKGEIIQKSYEPEGTEDDNCFSEEKESWDTQFWYCDLLEG